MKMGADMRGGSRHDRGHSSAFGGMPHGMFFTTSPAGNPAAFGYGGSRHVLHEQQSAFSHSAQPWQNKCMKLLAHGIYS